MIQMLMNFMDSVIQVLCNWTFFIYLLKISVFFLFGFRETEGKFCLHGVVMVISGS